MKDYLFSLIKKRQYTLFILDILVLSLAVFLSYGVRVYLNAKNPTFHMVLSRFSPWQIIVILSHLLTLYLLDQYNLKRLENRIRSSIMVVLSVWLAGLIISSALFFFPKYIFGRQVLLIHLLVVSICMVLWRLLFSSMVLHKRGAKRLAVVGDVQIVSSFIEEMAHIRNSGFEITSLYVSNRQPNGAFALPLSLARCENVLDLLKLDDFDALAFDSTCSAFTDDEIRLILQLKYRNKMVYDLPKLFKNLTGKIPLSYIDGRWLLASDGLQGELSAPYVRAKRVFDIFLSALLLLITLPLFAVIAVVLKIDSRGSVFFVQERLGIGKKPFKCIKFRTMVQNAEAKSGPVWSKGKDPRITRVGRFLRKSRLDELPQFWNILKGDMSFVGPRPIREHFASKLGGKIPFYDLRFSVKPGLSGWAQVNYGYAGSEEGQLEKFQYELFYIQNMSLFMDLLIVIKTFQNVFKGTGV